MHTIRHHAGWVVLVACILLGLGTGCEDNVIPCVEGAQCASADGGFCGDKVVQPGEQCDDGKQDPNDGCNQCRLWTPPNGTALTLPDTNTWEYYNVDGAVCRDGSPAGFAISPGSDPTHVLFYFEGGGACFDMFTCGINPQSVRWKQPSATGIFNRANPKNPFGDWTFIYIPYCTGDVFTGAAPDQTIKGLIDRNTRKPLLQQFVGYTNTTRFLDHIAPTLSDGVVQVVSSGSSAGGIGALANAVQIARAFPDANITVLDDSAPPFTTKVVTACLQEHIRDLWRVDKTILPDCGRGCLQEGHFFFPATKHLVTMPRNMSFGLFDFNHDPVMKMFYTFGINDCQMSLTPPMKSARYSDGLKEFRTLMQKSSPRVATYYAPGASHTCIQSACFYDMNVDGKSLAQWTWELVHGIYNHVGSAYTDAAAP